jgi:hypothetical protein
MPVRVDELVFGVHYCIPCKNRITCPASAPSSEA